MRISNHRLRDLGIILLFIAIGETLAKDLIDKVGPGGQFLKEIHTHRYLKSEHITEVISNRCSYNQWTERGGLDIVHVAKGKAKEILREHKPNRLDEETSSKIREIIKKYDKKLE